MAPMDDILNAGRSLGVILSVVIFPFTVSIGCLFVIAIFRCFFFLCQLFSIAIFHSSIDFPCFDQTQWVNGSAMVRNETNFCRKGKRLRWLIWTADGIERNQSDRMFGQAAISTPFVCVVYRLEQAFWPLRYDRLLMAFKSSGSVVLHFSKWPPNMNFDARMIHQSAILHSFNRQAANRISFRDYFRLQ